MDPKKVQEKVEETLDKIFSLLGIQAQLDVSSLEAKGDRMTLKVEIESEDANILIGYHGDTLNSLQHILNTVLYREFGEGLGTHVDISGYRKQREDKIVEVAEKAASKARFLNKSIALYPMNSFERRLVHSKVNEIEGVSSESEGEGYNRRVIIKPTD